MGRVVHFEIQAEDPERAARFYSSLFGWQFSKWEGPVDYWLIATGQGPGIDGGLLRRRGPAPAEGQAVNASVCTLSTTSVDEDARKIPLAGGQVIVPKMAVPGIGWLLYAKDPEGNIFGLMENDPQAR